MALVPDNVAPSVQPDATPPSDYQNIPAATPAAFGGMIGAATERTGKEGVQAFGELNSLFTQRYNTISVDDAFNNFQKAADNLTYGDPGDPAAPKGLYTLRGADALNAGPGVVQQLSDMREQMKAGLRNTAQQLLFDEQTRRLLQYKSAEISRHLDQQGDVYGLSVNEATIKNSARSAGLSYNSDDALMHALSDATGGAVKAAQIRFGASADSAVLQSSVGEARSVVVRSAVQSALAQQDTTRAAQIMQKFGGFLDSGTRDTLSNHVKALGDVQDVDGNVRTYMMTPGAAPGAGPNSPVLAQVRSEAAAQGVDPVRAQTFAMLESSGGSQPDTPGSQYKGVFQLSDSEFNAAGQRLQRGAQADEIKAGIAKLKRDQPVADQIVGGSAQPWQTYLVHVEGAGGASGLLNAAPGASAIDIMAQTAEGRQKGRAWATQAILGNIPTDQRAALGDNPTAQQFTSMWQQKYASAEAGVKGGAVATSDAAQPPVPGAFQKPDGAWYQHDPYGSGQDIRIQVGAFALPQQIAAPPASVAHDPGFFDRIAQQWAGAEVKASQLYPTDAKMQMAFVEKVHRQLSEQVTFHQQAEAEQAKALRDAQEATANGLVTTLLRDPGKFDPQTIANNPTLTTAQKLELNRAAQVQMDRVRSGKEAGVGPKFNDDYTLVTAPAGTPGRITDVTVLWRDLASGDLTPAGYDKLQQTLVGRRTQAGEDTVTMKRQFEKVAHNEISGKSEALGFHDPKGEAIYGHFLTLYLTEYEKRVAAGESPSVLLDTGGGKGSLLSLATALKRPQNVWMADMMEANDTDALLGTKAPKAPAAAVDLSTPQGVVAAYRAQHITREAASAALLKLGVPASVAAPASPTAPQVPTNE